jgi:alanine racemase
MSERDLAPWRRAKVTIDLDALSHNFNKVREYAPGSRVMAVIKANAYGHGMLAVAERLADAEMFAVAMPSEAYALRAAGCAKPILVLHGFSDDSELEQFSALNLSAAIFQQSQLDKLVNNILPAPIDAWIKVDTGMHRLGVPVDAVEAYFGRLRNSKNVTGVYLMSHFANADDIDNHLNNIQLLDFFKATNDIEADCSMANSAAIIKMPKSHFEVVRPGIMLYGSSPFPDVSAADLGLQAAMQFESILIDIKQVKAGEPIGYGGIFTSDTDITIGVVAVGYGDGYPRHARNGTPVWLNNRRCALVGRVSMDSLCVNLTGVDASAGDRVVLWGKELTVDAVAQGSDSISYELLCNAGAAYAANR